MELCEFRINTTALNSDERNEMAKMLFKCGYAIRLEKEKSDGKIKYFIVCGKEKVC